MDVLMRDHDEWDQYQDEMQARKRDKYLKRTTEGESRATFIT